MIIKTVKKINKIFKNKIIIKELKKKKFVDIIQPYKLIDIEKIKFGEYCYIGPNAFIYAKGGVKIGSNVIIGPFVKIWTENHNWKSNKMLPYDEVDYLSEVIIHDNVWIGLDVKICPGTIIGEGAIIGMGSVVRGDIPPLAIVVGNPGKIIKYRDSNVYNEITKSQGFYYKLKKTNNITKKEMIRSKE